MVKISYTLLAFVFGSVCWSSRALNVNEFENEIKSLCFGEDKLQYNPLASTLENFLSLIEKIENANRGMTLQEELFYLLRNYTLEHIKFNEYGVPQEVYLDTTLYTDVVKTLWEPDENKRQSIPNNINNALTDEERCSLFFMMSRNVVLNKANVARAPHHTRPEGDIYPQEQGVVAIEGSNHSVSLSRVVVGLYTGLLGDQRAGQTIQEIRGKNTFDVKWNRETPLDRLYATTLAEPLVMAKWKDGNRNGLLRDGKWIAGDKTTQFDRICPNVYHVLQTEEDKNKVPAFSYSSVRGGADGLILGEMMQDFPQDIRLSQVLRSYYGRNGPRTFCRRLANLEKYEVKLKEQMDLFPLLVASNSFAQFEKVGEDAFENIYNLKKKEILNVPEELGEFCSFNPSIEKPETLPLETPIDVLFVMESGIPQSEEKQRIVIGHVVTQMGLNHQFTVVTDERNGTAGLRTLVSTTQNPGCAACKISRLDQEESFKKIENVEETIYEIDKLLEEKRKEQIDLEAVPAKVVVFFNSQDNENISPKLKKALADLYLHNRDVVMYTVGLNKNVLLKYAREDGQRIVSITDKTEEEVAKDIYSLISAEPALLQYTDCKLARNEPNAVYKYFVSPNSLQHWYMPPQYFYKSFTPKIWFEPVNPNDDIKVCWGRSWSKVELTGKKCYNTTMGERRVEFRDPNPCKGFNEINCSPFYFSVLGVNHKDQQSQKQYCKSNLEEFSKFGPNVKCNNLEQIQFKVWHEGIRCSGSIGLLASHLLVYAALIISLVLFKEH